MNTIKQNKIVVIAVVVVLIFGAWIGLSEDGSTDEALVTQDTTGVKSAQEKAALDTLLQLRSIQLTGSIFSDPAFQLLRDTRTEIVAEPVGRRNPFAPLGTSAPQNTATTSTDRQ